MLRSFVNQKMTSPESRLDYLQDYFVDAKLDEQELSEVRILNFMGKFMKFNFFVSKNT